MTSKTDVIISMLDEILARLDRIERAVDFSIDDIDTDYVSLSANLDAAFEGVFQKDLDKPVLSVVKSDNKKEDNVVEFKIDE